MDFALGSRYGVFAESRTGSWPDLDGRAVGYGRPNLFDFLVGDSDAADRPVDSAMRSAQPAETVRDAVNHDVAARIATDLFSASNIGGVGIRQVKRAMVVRVRVPGVDAIRAFGGPFVPFALFRSNWRPAERDLVRLDRRISEIQCQFSFRLHDDDSIGAKRDLGRGADAGGKHDSGDRECWKHSARFYATPVGDEPTN